MAHFAKVENGVVVDLIVINNDDCNGGDFPESESFGRAYIAMLAINDLRLNGEWFQTSYNDNFRGRLGQIGFVFDPDAGDHGEFIEPEGFFPPDLDSPTVLVDELEEIANASE